MIDACPFYREEMGKVAYLTVQESEVTPGATQRRPGLHIESPGVLPDPVENLSPNTGDGGGAVDATGAARSFSPAVEHSWGMGVFFGPDRYEVAFTLPETWTTVHKFGTP